MSWRTTGCSGANISCVGCRSCAYSLPPNSRAPHRAPPLAFAFAPHSSADLLRSTFCRQCGVFDGVNGEPLHASMCSRSTRHDGHALSACVLGVLLQHDCRFRPLEAASDAVQCMRRHRPRPFTSRSCARPPPNRPMWRFSRRRARYPGAVRRPRAVGTYARVGLVRRSLWCATRATPDRSRA